MVMGFNSYTSSILRLPTLLRHHVLATTFTQRCQSHRTPDAVQHCPSSCSPDGPTCPDRRSRHAPPACAARRRRQPPVFRSATCPRKWQHWEGGTHPDDAVLPNELDQRILRRPLGHAVAVRLDVAQVADVTVRVFGCAVLLAERVDWTCLLSAYVSRRPLLLTPP